VALDEGICPSVVYWLQIEIAEKPKIVTRF